MPASQHRPMLVLGLLLLLAPPTLTQTPLAPPPRTPYGSPITCPEAKRVAAAAVGEAQRNGWNMAIAIVDP